MNEKEFAQQICQRLTEGSRQMDGILAGRLEEARTRALAGARVAERDLIMASHASQAGNSAVLGFHSAQHQQPHHARAMFVGLALIALMAGMAYWQQATDDDGGDQGLLDAKMLSSELPLYTFLHPDFKEWVNNSR